MMAVQKYLIIIFAFFCTSPSYTWAAITCHDTEIEYDSVGNSFECGLYYRKFEQALLNDPTIIWRLQQVFIQENPVKNAYLDVQIQAKTKCNQLLTYSSGWIWQQSSLSKIVNVPELIGLDVTLISGIIIVLLEPPNPFFSLPLHIDELPCSANESDIGAALPPFLSWIKAYAKWHGRPDTWDISDKGVILDSGVSPGNKLIQALVMAGYVFELLLVFVLVLRFVWSNYQVLSKRVQRNRTIYSIYWGSGFIAVLLNIISISFTVVVGAFTIQYSLRKLGFAMCGSFVLLSLPVAVLTVRRSGRRAGVDMPIPTKAVQIFCCCWRCCSKNTKSMAFQMFILWNILIFIHIVVTSTIPLCILIILYPPQTLSIIGLIFSTIFCFIMLVAHLFHFGQLSWYIVKLCSSMLAILLLLGLVITFILFYIFCLKLGNAIHTGGVGAFLVSLLPSLFLSAVGWYVKRKFLKTNEKNGAVSEVEDHEIPDLQDNSNSNEDIDDLEQVVTHSSAQTVDSSLECAPLIQQED